VARQVRVLIEDVELGEGLSAARLRQAERACLARVILAPRGPWRDEQMSHGLRGGFGLLVLKGLLSRRVGRGGRFGAELLGPGDLLRPWDDPSEQVAMPFDADWKVIQPVSLAVLDLRFAARATPYPEIPAQLIRRAVLRSRRLAATMAIVHEPRIATRVHMLLWTLAERWGRVRPDGVVVSLPLTHALLADMVAASRPAVTDAVSALTSRGLLRRDRDRWLLRGGPPRDLENTGQD
jgi:CRP/FNR family transcriptional regulator, cyclic AMP receptor protein